MGGGGNPEVKPVDCLFIGGITVACRDDDAVVQEQLYAGGVALLRRQGHHAEKVFSFLQEQPDLLRRRLLDKLFDMRSLLCRVYIGALEVDSKQALSPAIAIFPCDFEAPDEFLDGVSGQGDHELRTSPLQTIFIYGLE